jgi:hypothetical protein
MAGFGISQEQIAQVVGIRSPKTLRKYFRQELSQAAVMVNLKVATRLYKEATQGNVAAAIFWLKARGGWSENSTKPPAPVAPDSGSAGQRFLFVQGECTCGHPHSVHSQTDPDPSKMPCQVKDCACLLFRDQDEEGRAGC